MGQGKKNNMNFFLTIPRKILKFVKRRPLISFILTPFVLLGIFAAYIWWKVPSQAQIKGCITTTMFQVELCPGSKNYVPLKKIASSLRRAVVFAEDSRFYSHEGFDWESIEKSARENLEKGKVIRGGSTISQQLSKNMFLSQDKNYLRKFLEALITYKIEKTLTKDEILERYLNVVEFGKDIYGAKAAAQFYFKKAPSQLSVLESAFLAMVLPNPPKYSRSFFKKDLTKFARSRIKSIVTAMHKTGNLSAGDYETAMANLSFFLSGERPVLPDSYNAGEKSDEDWQELLEEVSEMKVGDPKLPEVAPTAPNEIGFGEEPTPDEAAPPESSDQILNDLEESETQ